MHAVDKLLRDAVKRNTRNPYTIVAPDAPFLDYGTIHREQLIDVTVHIFYVDPLLVLAVNPNVNPLHVVPERNPDHNGVNAFLHGAHVYREEIGGIFNIMELVKVIDGCIRHNRGLAHNDQIPVNRWIRRLDGYMSATPYREGHREMMQIGNQHELMKWASARNIRRTAHGAWRIWMRVVADIPPPPGFEPHPPVVANTFSQFGESYQFWRRCTRCRLPSTRKWAEANDARRTAWLGDRERIPPGLVLPLGPPPPGGDDDDDDNAPGGGGRGRGRGRGRGGRGPMAGRGRGRGGRGGGNPPGGGGGNPPGGGGGNPPGGGGGNPPPRGGGGNPPPRGGGGNPPPRGGRPPRRDDRATSELTDPYRPLPDGDRQEQRRQPHSSRQHDMAPERPRQPTPQPERPRQPTPQPDIPREPTPQPDIPREPTPLPDIPREPTPLPDIRREPTPLPESQRQQSSLPEPRRLQTPERDNGRQEALRTPSPQVVIPPSSAKGQKRELEILTAVASTLGNPRERRDPHSLRNTPRKPKAAPGSVPKPAEPDSSPTRRSSKSESNKGKGKGPARASAFEVRDSSLQQESVLAVSGRPPPPPPLRHLEKNSEGMFAYQELSSTDLGKTSSRHAAAAAAVTSTLLGGKQVFFEREGTNKLRLVLQSPIEGVQPARSRRSSAAPRRPSRVTDVVTPSSANSGRITRAQNREVSYDLPKEWNEDLDDEEGDPSWNDPSYDILTDPTAVPVNMDSDAEEWDEYRGAEHSDKIPEDAEGAEDDFYADVTDEEGTHEPEPVLSREEYVRKVAAAQQPGPPEPESDDDDDIYRDMPPLIPVDLNPARKPPGSVTGSGTGTPLTDGYETPRSALRRTLPPSSVPSGRSSKKQKLSELDDGFEYVRQRLLRTHREGSRSGSDHSAPVDLDAALTLLQATAVQRGMSVSPVTQQQAQSAGTDSMSASAYQPSQMGSIAVVTGNTLLGVPEKTKKVRRQGKESRMNERDLDPLNRAISQTAGEYLWDFHCCFNTMYPDPITLTTEVHGCWNRAAQEIRDKYKDFEDRSFSVDDIRTIEEDVGLYKLVRAHIGQTDSNGTKMVRKITNGRSNVKKIMSFALRNYPPFTILPDPLAREEHATPIVASSVDKLLKDNSFFRSDIPGLGVTMIAFHSSFHENERSNAAANWKPIYREYAYRKHQERLSLKFPVDSVAHKGFFIWLRKSLLAILDPPSQETTSAPASESVVKPIRYLAAKATSREEEEAILKMVAEMGVTNLDTDFVASAETEEPTATSAETSAPSVTNVGAEILSAEIMTDSSQVDGDQPTATPAPSTSNTAGAKRSATESSPPTRVTRQRV
ncbi:hypothetical protein BJ508DRAFT_300282 [Ascobolus immersus RN42]|uniref:Uncharacterized protein n=1 Tax=Ascobolus immersus RN42 TaxID=1160509 RepID=A0A3N4IR51_ASCIM|nr:hypothetical protein BJ508DRAFT_300282 [Ascobolus immersus RN42]